MTGLLILNKPRGKSSHDLVYFVRRISGEKRVGHAGTLDPMATGVLILCLGNAVRVSEYLIDHDKLYRARVRLGVETDSYDATGNIVATRAVDVTHAEISTALNSFVGKISQTPPAHSAVQRDGVRAYKLARQGIAVEMQPRKVELYSIELRELKDDEVEFDVHCSKGTFIRSLAHDLGEKLGTGGHLSALTRLASGPFSLEESATQDELQRAAAEGRLSEYLKPLDRALTQFDALTLDKDSAQAVRQGKFLPPRADLTTLLVRAYDENGELIALLERTVAGQLKPKKVFAPNKQPQDYQS